MKKVVVTGATGFIGRHTLPLLIAKGYEVHAISSQTLPSKTKNIHWHQVNLLDAFQTERLIEQVCPTHLLHFSWYATPGKFWTSPMNLDWVAASLNLVKCFASAGGKRIVIAGTCAEYDWNVGTCHESMTPLRPATLYGTCKAALYQVFEKFCQQTNLSGAWGRIFFVYGPHEPAEKLIASAIQHLIANQTFPCSHGNQVRDFLHVEDVADAFVKLLDSDVRGAVNVASGRGTTLKALITAIGNHLKKENNIQFGALKTSLADPPILVADTSRLATELQWQPRYSTEDGLKQTISWHMHQG